MSYKEITTVEIAFNKRGLDPSKMPDLSMIPERFHKYMLACYKLAVVIEAINGDWRPDYTDHDQPKYYAWPWVEADEKRPGGFGFSLTGFGLSYTLTYVGSRLCMEKREYVYHLYEHFKELLIDHHLIIE